jgi:hypothetical protein
MAGTSSTANPNASHARYYRQGPHDGLCGLYATLNAFRCLTDGSDGQGIIDDDRTFFNEAVECLARVGGVGVRVIMNDPYIGGVDQYQMRDLAVALAERINLDVRVTLIGPEAAMTFARRYRTLQAFGEPFSVIAAFRDGSHWVAITRHSRDAYGLIDGGRCRIISLRDKAAPRLAKDAALVLTRATGSAS